MDPSGIQTVESTSTAQYVALNDSKKDLFVAMADMSILSDEHQVATDTVSRTSIQEVFETFWYPQMQAMRPSHLVVDANWSAEMLEQWLGASKRLSTHTSFEPVSSAKAARLFASRRNDGNALEENLRVHLASPNSLELSAMFTAAQNAGFFDNEYWWPVIDALGIPSGGARTQLALATSSGLVDEGIPQQTIQLLPYIPCILTKLGPEGVLLTQLLRAGDPRLSDGTYAPHILSRCGNGTEDTLGVGGVYMRLFPAVEQVPEEDIVSVNGVGDTFLGAIVAGLERGGKNARVENLVDVAQRAAVLTLKSAESVSPAVGVLTTLLD